MIDSNGHPRFHLFLSPHLDDVVLSCGGSIYQLAAKGHTVVVYTVMAGKPARLLPESPILSDLHTRWETGSSPVSERRWEDIKGVRSLGAIPRHGAIPDCVYRLTYQPGGEPVALYPSEESLWGPVHPADTAPMLLGAMPLPYPETEVLHIPLGAGGHVDHRLVWDWGRRLAHTYTGIEVLFYEEYPYSARRGAVQKALQAFAPQPLEAVLHPLDEAALAAKTGAIACYESQISTFWQHVEDMNRAVRADALFVGEGQPAEREWRYAETPTA
ncbi:MAG: PIG-L family deacetylase [Anaerolineae bacterium]|nr:PIG-L family deacetylase [Anaerolineae bacterium]